MTRTRWRHPVSMSEAVSATLRRLGLEGRVRQEEIWHVWSTVVGPHIARHAQPHAVRHGRLIVHVTDPVWLHQLSMMRHRLVPALNERLNTLVIHEILLRVGELPALPPPPTPSTSSGLEIPQPDPVRQAEIDALLAPLEDAPCREAVRRLLLRARQDASSHRQR